MPDFTLNDYVAAPWFFVCRIGCTLYSDGPGAERGDLIGVMARRRLEWMMRMLGRENRIGDIQVIDSLQRNASFFASASILILAGLIKLLGATEKAIFVVLVLDRREFRSRPLNFLDLGESA